MSETAKHIYPAKELTFIRHASRRSTVHSTRGMVACTQPLAAEAGQRILRSGGNAADASIAVAAALGVTEPASTGIGGDMFCLYWDAKQKQIHALNGSGRSPRNTTLQQLREELGISSGEKGQIPLLSALAATVPGAAAGWVDTIDRFGSGRLTLEQILTPAIELAELGFPVSELSASYWKKGEEDIKQASPNFREMLRRDPEADQAARAPHAGEVFRNPTLAETLRVLATEGKKGFYTGRIAQAIVDAVKGAGGHMELDDLEFHLKKGTENTEPISLKFRGQNSCTYASATSSGPSAGRTVELWEHPPNGQGIVALMALGMLEELWKQQKVRNFSADEHNCPEYLHAVIETLKIALADANWWVTDPDHSLIKPPAMVSQPYLTERARLFNATKAGTPSHGQPGPSPAQNHNDTVYFCTVDQHGNAMSFINSVYASFGTAIVPEGCGFTLQSRGANFELGPEHHPNIYAGGKRPYHTIIPGLVTQCNDDDSERVLHSVFGVMGGFMQPQGHVQVLLNMEMFDMNPQQALDAPRICIGAGTPDEGDVTDLTINIEEGIPPATVVALEQLGHKVKVLSGTQRSLFGRGQIIRKHVDDLTMQIVYSGGSDLRGDGCAMPA